MILKITLFVFTIILRLTKRKIVMRVAHVANAQFRNIVNVRLSDAEVKLRSRKNVFEVSIETIALKTAHGVNFFQKLRVP